MRISTLLLTLSILLTACGEPETRRVPGGGSAGDAPVSTQNLSRPVGTLDADTPRYALVMGLSRYNRFGTLANPVNDAELMAETLTDIGFALHEGRIFTDLDRAGMVAAIDSYGAELRRRGGVGFVYYAGHGVQVGGRNHLIPVDAALRSAGEVEAALVPLDHLFDRVRDSEALNVVILDACRNNPFSGDDAAGRAVSAPVLRDAAAGLSRVTAPANTLVGFATAPGAVAYDGEGSNSPYAEALARTLEEPGLRMEDIFIHVRNLVAEATENRQVPWETSSLRQVAILNDTRKPGRSTNLTSRWDGAWEGRLRCEALPGDFGPPEFITPEGQPMTIRLAYGEAAWIDGPSVPGTGARQNHHRYDFRVFDDNRVSVTGQYEFAEDTQRTEVFLRTNVGLTGTVENGVLHATGNRGPRQCSMEFRPRN